MSRLFRHAGFYWIRPKSLQSKTYIEYWMKGLARKMDSLRAVFFPELTILRWKIQT